MKATVTRQLQGTGLAPGTWDHLWGWSESAG